MPNTIKQCIDNAFETLTNNSKGNTKVREFNLIKFKNALLEYLKNDFQTELDDTIDPRKLTEFEKNLQEYGIKEAKLDLSAQLAAIKTKRDYIWQSFGFNNIPLAKYSDSNFTHYLTCPNFILEENLGKLPKDYRHETYPSDTLFNFLYQDKADENFDPEIFEFLYAMACENIEKFKTLLNKPVIGKYILHGSFAWRLAAYTESEEIWQTLLAARKTQCNIEIASQRLSVVAARDIFIATQLPRALIYAAAGNKVKGLAFIIEQYKEHSVINYLDSGKTNAMEWAIHNGHLEAAKTLWDSNPKHNFLRAYFQQAIVNDHQALVEYFLDILAENLTVELMDASINDAASYGQAVVLKILLNKAKQANLKLTEDTGRFALIKAIRHGHLEAVKVLWKFVKEEEQRLNIALINNSLIDYAKQNNCHNVIEFLNEQGLKASVQAQSKANASILPLAMPQASLLNKTSLVKATSSKNVSLIRSKYDKEYLDISAALKKAMPGYAIDTYTIDPDKNEDSIEILAKYPLGNPPVIIFGPSSPHGKRGEEMLPRREYLLACYNMAYILVRQELADSQEDAQVKFIHAKINAKCLFIDKVNPVFNPAQIQTLREICQTQRPLFTEQEPVTLNDALLLLKIFKQRLTNEKRQMDKAYRLAEAMADNIAALQGQTLPADFLFKIFHLVSEVTKTHKTKEDIEFADKAIQNFAHLVESSKTKKFAKILATMVITAIGLLAAAAAIIGVGIAVGAWATPMLAAGSVLALAMGGTSSVSSTAAAVLAGGTLAGGAISALLASVWFLKDTPEQRMAKTAKAILHADEKLSQSYKT